MALPLSPYGIVVFGMHRSGTSALARILVALGASAGAPEHLLGATDANPLGHFEPAPLVQANESVLLQMGRFWHAPPTSPDVFGGPRFDAVRAQLATTFDTVLPDHGWAYKDPRLCVMWPLYSSLFPLPPVGVLVVRDPREVAMSLHTRDGMSLLHSVDLWELHNRAALHALGDFPARLLITHRQLIEHPDLVAERLVATMALIGLEADPDGERVGRAIDPELARAQAADVELDVSQSALWHQLVVAAETGELPSVDSPSAALRARIDRRAELVTENIRALQFGWMEPTEDLRRPG